jgi:hypothetical protein
MTPHDEELQSRLLRDAAFVEYPVHLAIEGLRTLLYGLLTLFLAVALPTYCFFHTKPAKQAVNEALKQGRYILQVDFGQAGIAQRPAWLKNTVLLPLKTTRLELAPSPQVVDSMFTLGLRDGSPIPICDVTKTTSAGTAAPTITTIPTHWVRKLNFIFDPYAWVTGKSVPMYRAYAVAAYTTAEMRSHIAELQTYSTNPPVCSHNEYGEAQVSGVSAAVAQIVIPDAPKVRVAYATTIPPAENLLVDSYIAPDFLLMGLCVEGHCTTEDLQFHVSHDSTGPSYTLHQSEAMKALTKVDSAAYWVATAHANGVYQDDLVIGEFEMVHARVAAIFPPQGKFDDLKVDLIKLVGIIILIISVPVILYRMWKKHRKKKREEELRRQYPYYAQVHNL